MFVIGVQSNQAAFSWQGRYGVPVYAAAFILMIPTIDARWAQLSEVRRRRYSLGTSATALALSCCASAVVLFRYQYGYRVFSQRFAAFPTPTGEPSWHPVLLPGMSLLTLSACGTVALFAALYVATRIRKTAAHEVEGVSPQAPAEVSNS